MGRRALFNSSFNVLCLIYVLLYIAPHPHHASIVPFHERPLNQTNPSLSNISTTPSAQPDAVRAAQVAVVDPRPADPSTFSHRAVAILSRFADAARSNLHRFYHFVKPLTEQLALREFLSDFSLANITFSKNSTVANATVNSAINNNTLHSTPRNETIRVSTRRVLNSDLGTTSAGAESDEGDEVDLDHDISADGIVTTVSSTRVSVVDYTEGTYRSQRSEQRSTSTYGRAIRKDQQQRTQPSIEEKQYPRQDEKIFTNTRIRPVQVPSVLKTLDHSAHSDEEYSNSNYLTQSQLMGDDIEQELRSSSELESSGTVGYEPYSPSRLASFSQQQANKYSSNSRAGEEEDNTKGSSSTRYAQPSPAKSAPSFPSGPNDKNLKSRTKKERHTTSARTTRNQYKSKSYSPSSSSSVSNIRNKNPSISRPYNRKDEDDSSSTSKSDESARTTSSKEQPAYRSMFSSSEDESTQEPSSRSSNSSEYESTFGKTSGQKENIEDSAVAEPNEKELQHYDDQSSFQSSPLPFSSSTSSRATSQSDSSSENNSESSNADLQSSTKVADRENGNTSHRSEGKGQFESRTVQTSPVDNSVDNTTQLMMMVLKIAKKERVKSLAAIPCRTSYKWISKVVLELQLSNPVIEFFCIDTDTDTSKDLEDLKPAFNNVNVATFVKTDVSKLDEHLPKQVDLVVSWMGVQEWGIKGAWKFAKDLKRSGVKLCLMSNNAIPKNSDDEQGVVNVRKAPMLFNEPSRVIGKVSSDRTKQLLLYEMDRIRDDF